LEDNPTASENIFYTFQGVTYTTREKIIDIGPIEATADTKKTISLPPIVGGLAIAGGVGLVIIGRKKPQAPLLGVHQHQEIGGGASSAVDYFHLWPNRGF
jgi:hypothetical protein